MTGKARGPRLPAHHSRPLRLAADEPSAVLAAPYGLRLLLYGARAGTCPCCRADAFELGLDGRCLDCGGPGAWCQPDEPCFLDKPAAAG